MRVLAQVCKAGKVRVLVGKVLVLVGMVQELVCRVGNVQECMVLGLVCKALEFWVDELG
jgi:hypothetical protein